MWTSFRTYSVSYSQYYFFGGLVGPIQCREGLLEVIEEEVVIETVYVLLNLFNALLEFLCVLRNRVRPVYFDEVWDRLRNARVS